jgi:glycerol-3-phosphate dehydrogenase (NAD(P)+)
MAEYKSIGVLGAGSWGTALAVHLANIGHEVSLWARRTEHADDINATRENRRYLPNTTLPKTLIATGDLEKALHQKDLVISVVPSHTKRSVWTVAARYIAKDTPVMSASKGIENESLALMSGVLEDVLPNNPLAFLAGPSFAKEVVAQLPTAVVIGSKSVQLNDDLQALFSNDKLRAYGTTDVIGIEVGGALKNVIAIACGCADGIGFGQNTRAAILTRGLAEITRMAVRLGADPRTLAGLGGMGDLVLTCCGDLSRNRRVGLGLGQGKSLEDILKDMGQVAEGVRTTRAARDLAKREQVDMPITAEIFSILYEDKPAKQVVIDLMRRGLKDERN